MKILYAIQGTGNGHLSRAKAIYPELIKQGEVDVLLSGIQVELKTEFPVKYRLKGLSFIFGSNGGVDILQTIAKNNFLKFIKEIKSLPVSEYDLVISDFEPVSAWACKLIRKECIGLSNQVALLENEVPKSKKFDPFGWFILKNYAPTFPNVGFHFQSYNENILTPIISDKIRALQTSDGAHVLVYLPAFSDRVIVPYFNQFKEFRFHIFSKKAVDSYEHENIVVNPISEKAFLHALAFSSGVITAAGFGLTSEALYLKKKLLVIPMSQQIEQACNAEALKEMGIPVIHGLSTATVHQVEHFLHTEQSISVKYSDNAHLIIRKLFALSSTEEESISTEKQTEINQSLAPSN